MTLSTPGCGPTSSASSDTFTRMGYEWAGGGGAVAQWRRCVNHCGNNAGRRAADESSEQRTALGGQVQDGIGGARGVAGQGTCGPPPCCRGSVICGPDRWTSIWLSSLHLVWGAGGVVVAMVLHLRGGRMGGRLGFGRWEGAWCRRQRLSLLLQRASSSPPLSRPCSPQGIMVLRCCWYGICEVLNDHRGPSWGMGMQGASGGAREGNRNFLSPH